MGELKANLGLNGDSGGHHQRRSRGRSSGGCCSSSSSSSSSTWSWLLFVLVLVSLAVSILVFWMTLYKQQELAMRLLGLEEERNRTLHDMVGKEVSLQLHLVRKTTTYETICCYR